MVVRRRVLSVSWVLGVLRDAGRPSVYSFVFTYETACLLHVLPGPLFSYPICGSRTLSSKRLIPRIHTKETGVVTNLLTLCLVFLDPKIKTNFLVKDQRDPDVTVYLR